MPDRKDPLEQAADRLLREDARKRGFVRKSGRGFTKYEREMGLTSESGLRRTYEHEAVGFSEEELDRLASESDEYAMKRRRKYAALDPNGGDENRNVE